KAIPFDMFGVEFGHVGDACSFETVVTRFRIVNPTVAKLAQIVHDLDLKESKYALPEAPALGRMVQGLRQMYSDDQELLGHGIVLFEAMYRSLAGEKLQKRSQRRRS